MRKGELALSSEAVTTIAELRQRMQDARDNVSQDDIGTFMTVCMREYTPLLLPGGVTLCFDVTVSALLTVTCLFHLF